MNIQINSNNVIQTFKDIDNLNHDLVKRKGLVFNIQRFSIHDGPGIRTTVFLKGCPLKCSWCSNPESQSCYQEPMFDTKLNTDITVGEYLTTDEIVEIVLKDKSYYKRSNGGVTISGGEVLAQSEFAIELLQKCREHGIHTACETTSFSSLKTYKKFLSNLDLLITDIKHYDEQKHILETGVGLKRIIRNIKYAIEINKEMWLRIPVIPKFNDSKEDAKNFAILLQSLAAKKVELLPFHQFGKNKYALLNRTYKYENDKPLYKKDLLEYKKIIEDYGIKVGFPTD